MRENRRPDTAEDAGFSSDHACSSTQQHDLDHKSHYNKVGCGNEYKNSTIFLIALW